MDFFSIFFPMLIFKGTIAFSGLLKSKLLKIQPQFSFFKLEKKNMGTHTKSYCTLWKNIVSEDEEKNRALLFSQKHISSINCFFGTDKKNSMVKLLCFFLLSWFLKKIQRLQVYSKASYYLHWFMPPPSLMCVI